MVPSYGSWLLNICQLPVKMIAGYASSNFPGGRIGSMLFTGWGVPVSTVFVRLAVGDGVAETAGDGGAGEPVWLGGMGVPEPDGC